MTKTKQQLNDSNDSNNLSNNLSNNNSPLSETASTPDSTSPLLNEEGSNLPINKQEDDYVLVDIPGKVYKRPKEVRIAIAKGHLGKKKKYTTWLKGKTGAAHPSYIHGQGKNREYISDKYGAWKAGVLQKYDFKCIITGENNNLVCHHLEAWSICEKGRYEITNGVPLKESLHQDFHKKYGSGTTTTQFEEYLQTEHMWGEKEFPWRQGNHEPSVSVEQIQEKQLSLREQKYSEFLNLCASRYHEVISGEYINAHSKVTVKCNKHNKTHETSFTN